MAKKKPAAKKNAKPAKKAGAQAEAKGSRTSKAKSLDKPSLAERYSDVHLKAKVNPAWNEEAADEDGEDEDGEGQYLFSLEYKPKIKGAIAQTMDLDATDEDDAKFEAANTLECTESELPEIEYE